MSTKIKHRFDDDDGKFDDKSVEETDLLLRRLTRQINRLQVKAYELRFSSAVMIYTHDPLTGREHHWTNLKGNRLEAFGMLTLAQEDQKRFLLGIDD